MPRAISTKTTVGKARAIAGITSAQLAKRSGVGQSTIQKIELGRFELSQETARKLGFAMMVSPAWLLFGNASGEPMSYFGDHPMNPKEDLVIFRKWTTKPPSEEIAVATSAMIENLKGAVDTVVCAAGMQGKAYQAAIDIDIAIKETMRRYSPGNYNWYFEDISKPTTEKARKPVKRRKKSG